MQNSDQNSNNSLRNNPFSKVFEGFSTEGAQARVDAKFQHKPYYIEYKLLRLTALATSYLFNGFSALTASALIFFFVQGLAGTIAAIICTVAAIVLLEMAKRFVGAGFFKNLLQYQQFSGGLFGVLLLLTGLSVASSYFGGKQTVKEFSGEADVISTDSTTAQVSDQIAAIDAQIAELSKQKDRKGVIYFPSQKTIGKLSEQKSVLMSELVRTRVKTDSDNDATTTEHQQTTALNSSHFALVTLLCEALFLLCAFYLEYYDWRTYVELRAKPVEDPAQANLTNNSNAVGFRPQPQAYGTSNRVVIAGFQQHSKPVNDNRNDTLEDAFRLLENENHHTALKELKTIVAGQQANGNNENRNNDNRNDTKDGRTCEHCNEPYMHRHHKQKYCSEACRIANWEARTGRKFNPSTRNKKP